MTKPPPLLSVVIPAYNYGRFLPKAVSSALDQDFDRMEVVVVDDCSTDDTPERLQPFMADSRFRYLRNERNLGAVPNVNKAFSEALGEFTLCLSSDDFLLPGSLRRLHEALDRNPEAGFAYGNYVIADDNDRFLTTIRHPGHLPCDLPPGRDDLAELLKFDCYIYMGATLFRTGVLREHQTFDLSLTIDDSPGCFFRATDWDLVLRLAQRGVQSTFVYAPLGAFRVHGNQASLGDDFNQQGIGPREAAVLLERYLVQENRLRLAGHESGILALLSGKREYYTQVAQPGISGDPEKVRATFERSEHFLRQLASDPCDEALEAPTLSVVLTQLDDADSLLNTLEALNRQSTGKWEAVVVNRGRFHMGNLCEGPEWAGRVRYIHLVGASLAEARNIGGRLARGELLYFHESGAPVDGAYLAYLATELATPGCVAVQCPIQTWEPEGCSALHGAWRSLIGMVLPAGHPWRDSMPPLAAFAMRRHVFLRLGSFDGSLPLLSDLDLILRLERDYPVHQLEVQSDFNGPSMVASLYQQNAALGNGHALEQALQSIVRRFALTRASA